MLGWLDNKVSCVFELGLDKKLMSNSDKLDWEEEPLEDGEKGFELYEEGLCRKDESESEYDEAIDDMERGLCKKLKFSS